MDILIQEQGSGGEVLIRNSDVVMVDGRENEPYIGNFGGDDWFGNDLFLQGDQKFTAQTEMVLLTTPLNSAGRILIESTIKSDLEFMENDTPGTTVDVVAKIASRNRVDADITINGATFYLNWNPDVS